MGYYSDPQPTLLLHLRQLGVGQQRLDSVTNATVQQYQAFADSIINGRLRPNYVTPLLQITRNNITFYPDPIPELARRLAAGHLLIDVFSELEPNLSTNAHSQLTLAETELQRLCQIEYFLEGQLRRSRNPGSNPYTEVNIVPPLQIQLPQPR